MNKLVKRAGVVVPAVGAVGLTMFGLDAMALPATFAVDYAAAQTDAESGKTLVVAGAITLAIISFGVMAVLSWIKK